PWQRPLWESGAALLKCAASCKSPVPREVHAMAALRRVFGDKAGPEALGILVPPGPRTVVVIRPRALPWDLLLIERSTDEVRFRAFAREEAEAAAEAFARALDDWSADRPGSVEAIPAPGCPGRCVRAEVGTFCLIACPRLSGQAYRPMVWAT